MTSLRRPSAASSTILARMTSRYGDVYLRARASNAARSSAVSSMMYGLCLGVGHLPVRQGRYQTAPQTAIIIRHRNYEIEY